MTDEYNLKKIDKKKHRNAHLVRLVGVTILVDVQPHHCETLYWSTGHKKKLDHVVQNHGKSSEDRTTLLCALHFTYSGIENKTFHTNCTQLYTQTKACPPLLIVVGHLVARQLVSQSVSVSCCWPDASLFCLVNYSESIINKDFSRILDDCKRCRNTFVID